MYAIGGSQSSQAQGYPRIYFQKQPSLSRSLFQMGILKGLSNRGYNPDPEANDVEPEIDYNSFADDQEFRNKIEVPVPQAEMDSGRGSHEETSHVNSRVSTACSSRLSRSGLESEANISDYSSDDAVGHFHPELNSSEESLVESNFEEGGIPLQQEDDTLEKRIEPWNVFATAPHIDSEESKQLCFALARKIMKVLTYLFMFPCMLGLIILSKGSILIAVANIRPYPRTYKSIAGDNNTIDNSTFYADGYDYSDTFDLGNDTTTPSMDLTTNASLANNEYSKKTNELYFALARKIMEDLTYLFMLSCMLGLIIFINRSNNIAVTNIRPYQKTYKSRAGASRGFYSRRGRRCRRRGRQSW